MKLNPLQQLDDDYWLLPETSDHLLHSLPIETSGEDGDTVRIVGQIRYAVSRE